MSINNQLKGLHRQFFLILAVVLTLGFACSPAQATPLGLTLYSPDITTFEISVDYDAISGVFSATTQTGISFIDADYANPIYPSIFNLNATIDSATGALYPGGIITIDGLIAGNLTGFGYGDADGSLEFLFTPFGGTLASDYGPVGGIILSGFGFSGMLTDDIISAPAFADTGSIGTPVPEPSTAVLLLLGGFGVFFARRRMMAKR